MDDLIAFFAARLDEDEHKAKKANQSFFGDAADGAFVGDSSHKDIEHIVRHDPARVLLDVAADRKLIARYTAAVESHEEALQAYAKARKIRGTSAEVDDAYADAISAGARTGAFLAVLEDRAARFADHEDFKPEWRP